MRATFSGTCSKANSINSHPIGCVPYYQEMVPTVPFILSFLLSAIFWPIGGNAQDWHTSDSGFKWFPNCDFPGNDIGQILIDKETKEQCGNLCIANPECTQFVYGYEDYCYMKNSSVTTPRGDITYDSIAICGYVPWKSDSEKVRDDWHTAVENETICHFYGNESLIFTTTCRKGKDCGTWYDSVAMTPGTKTCKLIDGSQGFCCPDITPKSNFPKERQWLTMIPYKSEKIIDANTTLTITCVYAFEDEYQKENYRIAWEIPDYLSKNAELTGVERRLRKTFDKNATHMTSTMTLTNTKVFDTGSFGCKGIPYGHPLTGGVDTQYVFVYDGIELVTIANNEFYFNIPHGQIDFEISCRPTHPDVKVYLIHKDQYTARDKNLPSSKSNILEDSNANWSFQPKVGLKLKKARIDDSGVYECGGKINNKEYSRDIFVEIMGMELTKFVDENDPLLGDTVTLICRFYYRTSNAERPSWAYHIGTNKAMQPINETDPPDGFQIKTDQLDYREKTLYESRLDFVATTLSSYIFQCRANEIRNISFRVRESISDNQELIYVQLQYGISQNLTCFGTSTNETFQWLKDGKRKELGTYTCRQTNRLLPQRSERIFIVSFDDVRRNTIVIAFSVAIVVLFVFGAAIGVKLYAYRKKNRFAGAFNRLLNGNVNQLNAQSPIEEQVEFLPYDKRWEFPRNRLKLGVVLGTGCFGRILKAEAVGMKDCDQTVKTVAVKMVRSETNVAAMEALISELKILSYLGSHLNVVNLLGACTKQLKKGDLLVIVEYCRFGNLQTYLIKHRNSFINQVDEFGNLKPDGEVDNNDIMSTNTDNIVVDDNQAHSIASFQMNSSTEILNGSAFSISCEPNSAISEPTTDPEDSKPLWQYCQDPSAISDGPMSSRDLISWAFQIARGMDYLVSKKVLHGDLAARNILLADDGVAKVADFGMSKKLYYYENYENKGQGLKPVKWMAIESLTDGIFSSKSDVWSYGVLLWEIYSLGKVPYPGMDVAHVLIKELLKGYRMDKPDFAPSFIADLMASCWKMEPKERPTFSQIEEIICSHMESNVSSNYLNMNDSYVKLNEEKKNATPNDLYGLAKMLQEKASSPPKENAKRFSKFPMRFSAIYNNDV
ncbi:LOW QUALITY PROTEIN: mast/stem cell growth factor receptor Kit [Daphnia magna]|uniref:LOW QUALITY PROTEIN: mast/stem cell growth factor receptor Kit n=1 Tax=Daphnia magna TaxID=35525 RepID=UPI001E1BA3C2|nr:LOW QUALITY PROTEIN: mast/stem cell growth factor receptor Kit [Daphnia magna]